MINRKQINNFLKITLIIIALAPLIYFYWVHNVPYMAFVLGAGSWGFGLIFKMIAHQLVIVPLSKRRTSLKLVSFVNGFISGLFELLAALIVILLMKHKFHFDFYAIISFGLAIGSWESLIIAFNSSENLLAGTALEKSTQEINKRIENIQGFALLLYEYFYPIGERILATFLHISTRGLVFVSILSATYYPSLIALITFIFADGFLGYYFNISGKLLTDKGFVQLYAGLFVLTVIITIIFFILIMPYQYITL